MRMPSFALALTAVVCGCGSSGLQTPDTATLVDLSSSGGDLPDLAVPQDLTLAGDASVLVLATQFDIDLANARCQHFIMCGQLDPANLAACVHEYANAEAADRDTEIMKGRLLINELQCKTAVQNARCDAEDQFLVLFSNCALLVFQPMQSSNGTSACVADQECINGYCQHGMRSNDGGTAPTGCAGVCAPFKATGQTCFDTANSSDCNFLVAICDPATNKCVPRVAPGGVCGMAINQQCVLGSYCDSTNHCFKPTSSGALNAACAFAQPLLAAYPPCAAGLFCKAPGFGAGTCTTKIKKGMPCTPGDVPLSFVDNQCEDGSVCFQTGQDGGQTASCQAYPSLGQACDPANDTCQETLYCDSTTRKCKALLTDGTPCDPTIGHCLSGHTLYGQNNCISTGPGTGICSPMKNFNDACSPATESPICASSYCSPATMRCSVQCN